MNPVVLNDKGQFRFNDFVGYLPEFLRSEPDVVTLMQVFSDYINNAYRNIETTEEFEFMLVSSNTNANATTARLQKLQKMFKLAEERSEHVILMSVPRNNIKSNAILGNGGAEYAIEIEIDGKTVLDSIEHAVSRGIDINTADGTVVYVKYREQTPIQTVAYYFDKATDMLIKDTMASSQDPFTSTYNNSNRMIQFSVSNVGDVSKRYGKEVNGVTYYEIYFTIHISDIEDVNALTTVEYNVDAVDNTAETILVDYYNTSSVSKDKYHATVGFFDNDGFEWKNGYPTGIFYFRESSGSKLTSLVKTNTVMSADITLDNTIERYKVLKVEQVGAGIINVYLDGYPSISTNGFVYLIDSQLAENVGVFTIGSSMSIDTRLDSEYRYITLVACDGNDVSKLVENDHLILAMMPLFYNEGCLDYSNKVKLLRWESSYSDSSGYELTHDTNVKLYGVSFSENNVIASNYTPSRINLCSFRLDTPITIGSRIYCSGTMWEGIATVMNCAQISTSEWKIDIDTSTSKYDNEITIYSCDSGIASYSDGLLTGYWSVQHNVDDYVLIKSVDGTVIKLCKIVTVDNDSGLMTVDNELTDEMDYFICSLELNKNIFVNKLNYVKQDKDSNYVGSVKYSVGDIFTQKYMLAVNKDNGGTTLLKMVTNVLPVETRVYQKGEYVSDGNNVYVATKTVTLKEGDNPATVYGFILDNYSHYSVGFKTVENAFMPFYGSFTTLDYGENPNYSDTSKVILPLYIKKQNDTRLRYGWKQREYLYYGDKIGTAGKSRSGFVEFYENLMTDHDIVDSDLLNLCDAYVDYPIMKIGCVSTYTVDIDSTMTAEKNSDGTWTVVLKSSNHGLSTGTEITVTGVQSVSQSVMNIFNQENVSIVAESDDVITYTVTPKVDVDGSFYYGSVSNAYAYYNRDYHYSITSVKLSYNTEESTENTCLRLNVENALDNLAVGDEITVSGVPYLDESDDNDINGTYIVLSDLETQTDTDKYVYVEMSRHINTLQNEYDLTSTDSRVYDHISNGDIVAQYINDSYSFYRVTEGQWEELDRTDIATPVTIYSQQNLFDVDSTNPVFAMSDTFVIKHITNNFNGSALVSLTKSIPYFTQANSEFIEGNTRVFIRNVYPEVYNGWHTVTKIHSPGIFEIKIPETDENGNDWKNGINIENRNMELRVGEWYKYTLSSIDWSKISGSATYAASNAIVEWNGTTNIVKTKYAHGFSVNDKIIVDTVGNTAYSISYDNLDGVNYLKEDVVTKVVDDYTFIVNDGSYIATTSIDNATVYRGLIVRDTNLEILTGEYPTTIDGETHSFTNGEIVYTLGQIISDEILAWRVVADKAWIPMRKKRVLKVDEMSVDQYISPTYNEYDEVNGLTSKYKYTTFSSVDVFNESKNDKIYYIIGCGMARNYHFEHIHVDELDTTQSIDMQYSSKFDYGTVAPRNDMDDSFVGVPDMKYPLIEKIERIAYLRDMNVIDYDLIGYLARFMGYDITAVIDDINSSNVYRTTEERQLALRETISHLPQYYTLGGTLPGVNMLMATFGLVADLVTMWTNTANPYGELIRQDDVPDRVRNDLENGIKTGVWVPTPHVTLEIPLESNFKNVIIGDSDVSVLKEQIRRFKPINVVFDEIAAVVKSEMTSKAYITVSNGTAYSSPLIASVSQASGEAVENTDVTVVYDDCSNTNCVF